MMLLALVACSEQGLNEKRIDALAVVLGDFDHVGDTLVSLGIGVTEYDGFVVQATYEAEEDRQQRGEAALTVEGLLSTGDSGNAEINLYQAAFINSGTRGLNAFQYNNPILEDDSLLKAPELLDVACTYAESGNVLVVSDWAYDLVEYCWPDAIEFVGDDAEIDAAQTGEPSTEVLALVGGDEAFKTKVGVSALSLTYDYSAWAAIESVGKNTEVLLKGDVFYQPSAAELPQLLPEAPLLVRFTAGKGTVLYSTFHWATQSQGLAGTLLEASIEGLPVKDATPTAEAQP
ncbi:MAG TPA: hypothetical protein PLA94_00560 [Myxococcota bacterium]|nr:hypothetical protein [Myxococcota bacterium]